MDNTEQDPLCEKLFEMRLVDIFNKHTWLRDEISLANFLKLFPVTYKAERALLPDKPVGFDLDRNIFLEVLLAFRQSF